LITLVFASSGFIHLSNPKFNSLRKLYGRLISVQYIKRIKKMLLSIQKSNKFELLPRSTVF
jgi:hypothetical protein